MSPILFCVGCWHLVQVSTLLCVHKWNIHVMSWRQCSASHLPILWLLYSSHSASRSVPRALEGALSMSHLGLSIEPSLYSQYPATVSALTVMPCKQRFQTPRLRSPLSLRRNRNIWKTYLQIFSILHTVILMGKYSANLKFYPFICEQNESHTD